MRHTQLGVTLPTVTALSLMCSVLLMADWRSISLAEGMGQNASQRWVLQQATHATLLLVVQDIQGPMGDNRHQAGSSKSTHVFFPSSTKTWATLQNRLGANECIAGICKPLGQDQPSYVPWLGRLSQAQSPVVSSAVKTYYWVEVLPLQTKWATTASPFVYRITTLAMGSSQSAVFATQALWHPTPNRSASLSTPMQLAGFKRLLSLSP